MGAKRYLMFTASTGPQLPHRLIHRLPLSSINGRPSTNPIVTFSHTSHSTVSGGRRPSLSKLPLHSSSALPTLHSTLPLPKSNATPPLS